MAAYRAEISATTSAAPVALPACPLLLLNATVTPLQSAEILFRYSGKTDRASAAALSRAALLALDTGCACAISEPAAQPMTFGQQRARAEDTNTSNTVTVFTLGASPDISKPILAQVGQLGPAYEDWVHKPLPGAPRFFQSSILEAITKTPWWVVPTIWTPIVAALSSAFPGNSNASLYGGHCRLPCL
ncbi:hypothetical protein WJX73_008181 [Symbiochloris irregularis]|uniref:Uncharacterized protein n=1 Tax=Symbiochloris irregularis TaxID=706552 RepID=A0AAW1P0M4_9CHLO